MTEYRTLILMLLKVSSGSGVSLEQAKFAAEKRTLNFSSPEADLGQFVLPAIRRRRQIVRTGALGDWYPLDSRHSRTNAPWLLIGPRGHLWEPATDAAMCALCDRSLGFPHLGGFVPLPESGLACGRDPRR